MHMLGLVRLMLGCIIEAPKRLQIVKAAMNGVVSVSSQISSIRSSDCLKGLSLVKPEVALCSFEKQRVSCSPLLKNAHARPIQAEDTIKLKLTQLTDTQRV